MSYLADLTVRLATGVATLPDDFRERHAVFLLAAQADDGGFPGRLGPGDPYYTSFALRALALLGRLDDTIAAAAGRFVVDRFSHELPSIDFLSLLTCSVILEMGTGSDPLAEAGIDRKKAAVDYFGPLRRDDGGYAKTPQSGVSSTYHTFLVAGCQQMLDVAPDEPERMVELIRRRRRDDHGFVEIDPIRYSGTNPTAAAVGLLKMLDALDPEIAETAAKFLADSQIPKSGFRANTRIPMPDLLSTFTALVAIHDIAAIGDLDACANIDIPAAHSYAQSLAQPNGGFRAGTWDDTPDVEYTFYGVATLGLLADQRK